MWLLLTLPQARQWCLRFVRVNGDVQLIHMVTRASGIHTGAFSPSLKSPSCSWIPWKVFQRKKIGGQNFQRRKETYCSVLLGRQGDAKFNTMFDNNTRYLFNLLTSPAASFVLFTNVIFRFVTTSMALFKAWKSSDGILKPSTKYISNRPPFQELRLILVPGPSWY